MRPTRLEVATILLIVVAACIPRFHLLDIWPGVGSDQAKTGLLAFRLAQYGEISLNPNIDYIGPIQTLTLAAMRPFFGASVWTIRLPVAVMAVVAVVVLWAMIRQILGPTAGILTAVIAAVYPWLVISGRYALDPMWLVLPNALLLLILTRYLRDGRSLTLLGTAALAGLGLTIHPAQLIVLPGLGVTLIWGWVTHAVRFRPVAAPLAGAVFLSVSAPVLRYHWNSLLGQQEVASQKLKIGIQDPVDFLGPALDILNGRQLYQFFGGRVSRSSELQTLTTSALVGGLIIGAGTLWRRGGMAGRALAVYFLIGLAFGYAFCSGMNRLTILGQFRYLICLAPLIPVFWGAGMTGLLVAGGWRGLRLGGAVCLACAMVVLPFQLHEYYFHARTLTGGAFDTYKSYYGDPKQLAAWYIQHNHFAPERTVILAQDYDLYYPLRYFLEDGYHIQTLNPESFIPLNDQYPFRAMAENPEADWVFALYSQSPLGRRISTALTQSGLLRPEQVVYEVKEPGAPDDPILTLIRVPPSPSRSEWARHYVDRMDIHHLPALGRMPPSGVGRIPRPSLVPQVRAGAGLTP